MKVSTCCHANKVGDIALKGWAVGARTPWGARWFVALVSCGFLLFAGFRIASNAVWTAMLLAGARGLEPLTLDRISRYRPQDLLRHHPIRRRRNAGRVPAGAPKPSIARMGGQMLLDAPHYGRATGTVLFDLAVFGSWPNVRLPPISTAVDVTTMCDRIGSCRVASLFQMATGRLHSSAIPGWLSHLTVPP